jgi:hypothetical protein
MATPADRPVTIGGSIAERDRDGHRRDERPEVAGARGGVDQP